MSDEEVTKLRSDINLLELEVKANEAWVEYVENHGEEEPPAIRRYLMSNANALKMATENHKKNLEILKSRLEDLLSGKSIIPAFRKIQIEEELLASENGEGYVKTDE